MNNLFDIKKAYYLFLLIRRSEEKIIELYNTDKIKSPVHLSIGQEAVAVGVSLALSESDIIFSNYRGHAHFIAREANLDKMWAELYGKVEVLLEVKEDRCILMITKKILFLLLRLSQQLYQRLLAMLCIKI